MQEIIEEKHDVPEYFTPKHLAEHFGKQDKFIRDILRKNDIRVGQGARHKWSQEEYEEHLKLIESHINTPEISEDSEDFDTLLEEYLSDIPSTGSVVKGTVTAIESGQVIIDIGSKAPGHIDIKEFTGHSNLETVNVGDEVDVFYESIENNSGLVSISREKARREEAWKVLTKAHDSNEKVTGSIFSRVKGGFTVDLEGATAFLPGSQVSTRPLRDVEELMGTPIEFVILKMDRSKNNIVVSRRAILEEKNAELRAEVIGRLNEGDIVEGVVKNVTDYGAFVDLGGVDGLLHITDISWRRIKHPSDVVTIGESIKVRVIKINKETMRISLGIKQLREDPWSTVDKNYPPKSKHMGQVTNITDYGAFVELEAGIEGLIHISEMSWTKKNIHPSKLLSTSQEIEVMVLNIEKEKRRISLGIKQTQLNPWEQFANKYQRGSKIHGSIRNKTEFGLFVGLEFEIDGMVHITDLSWDRPGNEVITEYHVGDEVDVVVSEINIDKERVALSVKDLEADPFLEASSGLSRGKIVNVTVSDIRDHSIEVKYKGITSSIKASELANETDEQRVDRFGIGDEIEVMVTRIDTPHRRINFSIRQLEAKEAKDNLAKYGTSSSNDVLGDIIGEALESNQTEQ